MTILKGKHAKIDLMKMDVTKILPTCKQPSPHHPEGEGHPHLDHCLRESSNLSLLVYPDL